MFNEFGFVTPKQERAKKAIDDIELAIELLSKNFNLEGITARDISDRSGYALGTIFHHFKKLDKIFIYLFLARRKRAYEKVIEIMEKHPSDQPLIVLLSDVINFLMDEMLRVDRKNFIFTVRLLLNRSKNPQLMNTQIDVLIPYWMNANQQDKTNTVLNYSEDELRLRLRAIQSIVRSPFLEENALAGTAKHREMSLNLALQIFSQPPCSE